MRSSGNFDLASYLATEYNRILLVFAILVEDLHDFDEAAKGRINSTELFEFRGNTKAYLNDYQGALPDLERAISMGASREETFVNLANIKFRMENYKEAIANYDKAIAKGVTDAVVFNNRGKSGDDCRCRATHAGYFAHEFGTVLNGGYILIRYDIIR